MYTACSRVYFQKLIMPQPHEGNFRRITEQFGSFPSKTYSYRIVSVLLTYSYTKRACCVGVRWQTYGHVTGA